MSVFLFWLIFSCYKKTIEDTLLLAFHPQLSTISHVEDVVSVNISNEKVIENIFNTYDYGTILDFEVGVGVVEFGILWTNFPPKTRTSDFSVINMRPLHNLHSIV